MGSGMVLLGDEGDVRSIRHGAGLASEDMGDCVAYSRRIATSLRLGYLAGKRNVIGKMYN